MWGFGLGGVHSLALILHVYLMVLLRFWEVHVLNVHGDQWQGEIVTFPDYLEIHFFGGKPCVHMEVSYCARQAWEQVNVVDSLSCCMVGIEGIDVSED